MTTSDRSLAVGATILFVTREHNNLSYPQNLPSDRWVERFADWLEVQGFLKK